MMFWKKQLIYILCFSYTQTPMLSCGQLSNAYAGEAFNYQQPRWKSDKASTTMMCSVGGEPCGEQKDSTIF